MFTSASVLKVMQFQRNQNLRKYLKSQYSKDSLNPKTKDKTRKITRFIQFLDEIVFNIF